MFAQQCEHIKSYSSIYAAAAAKPLQSCPTLCDPIDGSPPGSSVPGILQARTLSGLPFPSPMHESEKWKWSRSVVSDSSQPHGLQPTRLLRPWDFPGKSTGVGCHRFLPKVDELKVKEDYLARRFRMKRVTENNHSGLCLFHLTLVNAVMFY